MLESLRLFPGRRLLLSVWCVARVWGVVAVVERCPRPAVCVCCVIFTAALAVSEAAQLLLSRSFPCELRNYGLARQRVVICCKGHCCAGWRGGPSQLLGGGCVPPFAPRGSPALFLVVLDNIIPRSQPRVLESTLMLLRVHVCLGSPVMLYLHAENC